MATVDGKTSIKIDELIESSIISGAVNGSGHLILTTRGGADIDAGFIAKQTFGHWSSATSYLGGDVVGYAGQTWQALSNNTNKPPALYTSIWLRIAGDSSKEWAERDPYFNGDSLSADWDFFWKTGSPTVVLTSVAGEFETGTQALKISVPTSAIQRFYAKDENMVRDGEIITVSVRARLSATSANARLSVQMIQNFATDPVPLASGNVLAASVEGPQALTTSWATYNFTVVAGNTAPRAIMNIIADAGATASCVFLIDRVRIARASSMALEAYPVGSIYFNVTNVDPKTLLGGGTWAVWGSGRVPVGVDTGQTEFNTVEETGGAKTHTLDISEMPAHDHGAGSYDTSSDGGHDHNINRRAAAGTTGGVAMGSGTVQADGTTASNGAHTHTVTGTSGSRGGDGAHNNLQPYITVYMWKRTA